MITGKFFLNRGYAARHGSVLIIAMWSLCLLTVFAVYIGFGVRQKLALVRHLNERDSLRYIAEAGIKMAIFELHKKDAGPERDFFRDSIYDNPSVFERIKVGPGAFSVSYERLEDGLPNLRYGCEDEESKININTSDAGTMASLLMIVGDLRKEDASSLAYCIVDWRDADSFFQHPVYGAEDADYRSMKMPYESKDAEFEVPEELLLVKGMTPEIFNALKPYITIYTDGKININTTTREALIAMGLDPRLAEKILYYRKGDDLIEGTEDDNIFTSVDSVVARLSQFYHLSPSELAQLSNFVSAERFTVTSENFTINSFARLNGKSRELRITAVVNRDGRIFYWREGD